MSNELPPLAPMPSISASSSSSIPVNQATEDEQWMTLAVNQAKLCQSTTTAYNVGAVLVSTSSTPSTLLATGHSRQLPGNTHAEECCFIKVPSFSPANNSTLYTTMEPCSTRLSGKKSCTEWCLQLGINRVVIASKEPDVFVKCVGVDILERAGIEVVLMPQWNDLCLALNSHLVANLV